eukprot:SAG31_NODE_3938_length_3735_cov_3.200220_7_plen_56_part_00
MIVVHDPGVLNLTRSVSSGSSAVPYVTAVLNLVPLDKILNLILHNTRVLNLVVAV